jgi:metallo-beta-lactamase family protein
MNLTFWGATQDVTGSMTFVTMPEGLIQIDCGLYQGSKAKEILNKETLPVKPADIRAVLITHAHLDHSGYLPKLVRDGFRGKIYCTPPTAKLMNIILTDSASISKDDLYEAQDVVQTMQMVQAVEWHEHKAVAGGTFSFVPAGHILGAASIELKADGKKIVFSGDLGRKNDPLIFEPAPCAEADAVIMESTYGGKIRQGNIEKELHSFLIKISREARVGIIASFAVARGQMLISLINDFFERHPEDKFRIVIDSPMMAKANRVYHDYASLTKHPLMLSTSMEEIDVIEHAKEWESLRKKHGPLLIISSSGMLTGGRIGRHLMNWQDDEKAILFLPGYQGVGTPGRAFQNGERTMKGPDDEPIFWKGEVLSSEAFSSHADQSELLEWAGNLSKETNIYLVHGEFSSKEALKKELEKRGYKKVVIPDRGEFIKI